MGHACDDQLMRDRNGHTQFGGDLPQLRSAEPVHFNRDPDALALTFVGRASLTAHAMAWRFYLTGAFQC